MHIPDDFDASNVNNFQPISTLPFITKALEKTVFVQLQSFLSANYIFEAFQSGFKPLHSTECSLLWSLIILCWRLILVTRLS